MKTTFFLTALLIFSFTTQAQDQTKTYTDDKAGFALEFPVSWTTEPNYLGTHVMSLSPLKDKEDVYRESVSVIAENLPNPVILQKYYEMYLKIMQETLKEFKIINTTPVVISEQPAIKLVAQYAMSGQILTVEEYFVTKKSKGFIITCSALTSSYDEFRPMFEKMVLSLKL